MTTRFRVKEVLESQKMTQSELARRSGISFATINAMCANRTKQVALQTLDKLAGVLQVSPGELLERRRR